MKYLKELAIIFGITMAGELLNKWIPLPVPAGVYGLFLLLGLLCTKVIKLEDVSATGNLLLDMMPIMFVPAAVGLIEKYAELTAILIPFIVISALSTLIVMAVTGKTTEFIQKIPQEYLPPIPNELPAFSEDDNGKILAIVGGKPTWVSIPNAEEASF